MHTAISWFAKNPVAANLTMILLIVGGLMGSILVNQEEFPNIDVRAVSITVPYLGAAPEEVEKAVCIRVEEAIKGLEGIDKIQSSATEGMCSVFAELFADANATVALNEIKSRIDAINSFPVETERPIVSKVSLTRRVIQIALFGNADERTLKEVAREMRNDIASIDSISQVSVGYTRPYEMSIEVSEIGLRQYGITLAQVAKAIRNASLNMPGGTIRTADGEILIRTAGQAYHGEQYEEIVVLTNSDGTRLTLGEIAIVRDGFEEGELIARYNNQPAVVVNVSQVGSEDLIEIAEDVSAYLEVAGPLLPEGLNYDVWVDTSRELEERLDVLMTNAAGGLLLVVAVLALFLRFKLAMWVAVGIPVALLGTIAIFPYAGMTISTMTVMAFILVLGIVVDDAIVVGERIYAHEQMGKSKVQAAIDGTWEVSVPVIFGVLTTIAAFLPLVLVDGRMSDFFSVIGYVVIIALVMSIVESQLILPSHLAHRNDKPATNVIAKGWIKFQGGIAEKLEFFANNNYRKFVSKAIKWRYATAAFGIGVLILAFALMLSGRVIFGFFPAVEGNRVYAQIEMPEGTPSGITVRAAQQIESAAIALNEEFNLKHGFDNPMIRNTFTSIGSFVDRDGPGRPPEAGRSNIAEVVIDLALLSERDFISAKVVSKRWRELVGNIPDAVSLKFDADSYSAGSPIEYQIKGKDINRMREAAEEMKSELSRYSGVFDISDSFRSGKQEVQLRLLPEARNLGLTLSDLASQVRSAFYGSEAQRMQRGQDDLRVMVRFPIDERRSIGNLEEMYIRTPDGAEVPFYSVARFDLRRGFSKLNRRDGSRVVSVTADVDRTSVSPEEVGATIRSDLVPRLKAKYPALTIEMGGEQEERSNALGGLAAGSLLSLILIYMLLAIPLRSYLQPLVIMSVIPFGAVGAIFGHWIMGVQLMFFSALGIVALSGVVVNASLVLVDYVNRQRREGMDLNSAVLGACVVRFRPILLTSVTTFVGLIPLMMTDTPATAPFIPMAVSLAWGVLFATFITLLGVPCLYIIVEDWLSIWGRFTTWLSGDKSQKSIPDHII
ncbi:MAG: multidrug efflux pump subunit AcrB [Flavobacterium sp.]|jgi:multidrug efflux pump subunit AcrB